METTEFSTSKIIKLALKDTFPVLTGYLVLGFGFGLMLKAAGYGIFVAFIMSLFIYAGSMQYAAVGLLAGGAPLITVALTTFTVNIRHLFYGVSMLEKYKNVGKIKPYLIFTLTDETYSLLCTDKPEIPLDKRSRYYFLVSFFDHMYWISGSVCGAFAGSVIKFNSDGIDFALTALFLTIFTEQWLTSKNHVPAIIGLTVTACSLAVFGSETFLIPAMLVITLIFLFYKDKETNG